MKTLRWRAQGMRDISKMTIGSLCGTLIRNDIVIRNRNKTCDCCS
jgi:hypothetical protein